MLCPTTLTKEYELHRRRFIQERMSQKIVVPCALDKNKFFWNHVGQDVQNQLHHAGQRHRFLGRCHAVLLPEETLELQPISHKFNLNEKAANFNFNKIFIHFTASGNFLYTIPNVQNLDPSISHYPTSPVPISAMPCQAFAQRMRP